MKNRSFFLRALTLLFSVVGCFSGSLDAAIIISDGFDDGGFTNGTDPLDTAWSSLSVTTLGVAADTTIGSGNALNVDATGNFSRFVTSLPGTTVNPGEVLTLRFDYRFTQTPPNTASYFRIGFYNNGGTAGDETDNFGYGFLTNPGLDSNAGTSIFEEATGSSMLGGSPGGTAAFGTAGASFNSPTSSAHSAVFTMTHTLSGTLEFSASIDGGATATAIDLTPSTTTFHFLGFGQGGSTIDYRLDNIQLEVAAIPEPSTLGLAGLGSLGLCLAWLQKRRC